MSGEETSDGRAFGHVATGPDAGNSYQLSALGTSNWENLVANPATGDATVVAGTSDVTGGPVAIYSGQKQTTGNAVEKAGLTNGSRGFVKVDGVTTESSADGIPSGTRFSIVSVGGTGFQRPEDIAWDTQDPNVLYFVTTNAFTAPSRLWRLTFDDVNNPAAGGKIDELLDGSEGQKMLDNIAVSNRGQLILQEDPGNQAYVARVWRYYPDTDKLVEVAHFDTDLFAPGSDAFVTQDEESSGVIDASSILGDGWFLFDDQVHKSLSDPELAERGQYQALHVPRRATPVSRRGHV
jgi:secreted PhoX family phosphatase